MTIATDNDGPRGRLGAARVPWGRGLETEACAERTTEVRARAGARSARERRDSRARRAAAPPATARLAESLAEDCAGAPEDEAHPPRTTAAARHARGARCIAAIAGVTRRFDAVTAIVSALRARVCADERVEVIRRADWPTADPESGKVLALDFDRDQSRPRATGAASRRLARENERVPPLSAAQAHRPAARLFVRDTEGRLRDGSRPRSLSRGAMSRRPGGAFDPDDKYSKAKAQNVRSHATPPPVKSRGGVQGDVPRFASQQSSPAQSAESSEMAARVRSKLDAVADRLHGDERETSADLVKGSLDRLAFASQVSQVTDAFGSVGHDALDEVGSLANKATETVALFQAAQYASKWMPIDTHLTMKPTYVKVAAQSAERIKWYEDAAFESIVAAHADERDAILAENAGLRGMLGLEETSSENVARIRETEDGVNRALLMSAAEEIKRLRARTLVLEGEAARRRVKDSGFFSFGGGGADGVDTAQMTRLTTELARLEEDNGRQRWMIGEKDKQIKETQAKFAASEAYALRERLQECTEALQVAANLQAEQLQYLEDNALKKLLALDDQICDVQDDLDTRAHQLEQLRDLLHHYWAAGDERVAPTVASLAGFARDARTNLFSLKEKREAKTLGGIVTGLGRFGAKLGGGAVEQLLKACAPPPVAMPREGQVVAPPASDRAEEKEKESAAERGAPAATPAATPAASPAKRDTSDDPEDAGYQGDGDASTAPPTAEKMPPSASSSAAPSATATPVKKLESEEASAGGASSVAAPAREGGALPSPPFSASASASAPVPGARPARRRDAETAEERAARERAKRERRDASSAARRETSAAAHGHGRVGKKKDEPSHFTGFEDEASAAREKRERAAARPALPQPKLLGKAALREEERRKEEEARREKIGGFQGFGGDDADDSDSD